MAHFLVTGGCGFIGSHLVEALLRDGAEVTVLDDLSTGKAEQCHPDAKLMVGSVTEPGLVRALIGSVDGCFHLAAIASVPRCNREMVAAHQVNVGGLINLFQAARLTGRATPFVYASSAAIYGDVPGIAAEDVRPAPLSHYGCDKLACEQHGVAALLSCGIPSIGLRFFNVYGPRQDPASPYSGVISVFAAAANQARPIRINGDGWQSRDFVFVTDVVRAQLLAMARLRQDQADGRAAARVVNVCTGTPTTILDLARTVFGTLGLQPAITFGPPREGDIRTSLGATARAAAELGFRARVPLAEGIALTLAALEEPAAPVHLTGRLVQEVVSQ
ncbi:MAG TPA: NAD-dependent epimerase/dehydratase family protein [Geminicoccus sp.]|uniref:NAD-dependent epimerase/dehydratase family protein n=1 Tax=Geminicoccus sp. TaxID=2024832 RepID=UPI002C447956|nr:NAD-dependent epimerase/dehydratase family protein [Geminicoccus sp.]HWL71618.1 NAD-dependent epimerase/dehydratase family protein [Geminicoccus sp.]